MLLDQRFGRLRFSRKKYNLKCNVTFCWLVVLIHWEMVLVRTKLNRECVVYPTGLNHHADPHLLYLVHDTPCFKSRSSYPLCQNWFPYPLDWNWFSEWVDWNSFYDSSLLTITMTVSPHCTQIHDHTDDLNIWMDKY